MLAGSQVRKPGVYELIMKYLRLIRIQDQFTQFGAAIISGLILNIKDSWIILWAIATTFISFTVFAVNELVDRRDTDNYSWNPIHIPRNQKFKRSILFAMLASFSFLGLAVAYFLDLFGWAFLMLAIGIFYSIEPLRFKKRFGLDILAQLSVWWFLPLAAPIFLQKSLIPNLPLLVSLSLMIWSIFFPYQLADYRADKKAGLSNTHITLGLKNSLWFGFAIGLTGILYFSSLKLSESLIWIWPFLAFLIYELYLYVRWLEELPSQGESSVLKSIQKHFIRAKPFSQLLLPYLLLLFYLQG